MRVRTRKREWNKARRRQKIEDNWHRGSILYAVANRLISLEEAEKEYKTNTHEFFKNTPKIMTNSIRCDCHKLCRHNKWGRNKLNRRIRRANSHRQLILRKELEYA